MNTKAVTAEEAIISYIASRNNILSESTLHGYDIILKTRLQSIMKNNIYELTKLDIQTAISHDAGKGLGHKSIKDALALLRSACAYYDVVIPPTKKFTLPARSPKKGDLPELSEVLAVIIGSSVELPCLLSIWCGGMRMSEVRGLQYKDIVSDKNGNHYILIQRARIFLNGTDVVRDVNKTYGSTRKVPLPDYLYNMIQNKPHKSDTDFVIDESYIAITGRYKRLMKKHGLHISFHDLRALFATTMNELGVPKEILQKLGGWTNSKVLDSVYIRHSDQTLVNSIDLLSQHIEPIIEEKKGMKNSEKENIE